MERTRHEEGTAMNPHKFSAIAHRDHDYSNPISASKVERLLDLLPLDETSRVLDLGCGRAELALRIIERFGATVVAVDHSSLMLDQARERAEWTGALGKLHLDDIDIRDFRADPETFHLSVMLGSSGISGGMAGICNQLKAWTRSGGYMLIGVDYWLARAPADYLAALGTGERREFLDHHGNVQAGIDAGLIPMHAATASTDEWDEYEWKYCRAIEAYAREQPEDPDVPAMIERIRKWRDAYLKWGRNMRGFALYLFYRPGARIG
jgi:SAM-dependent methyltransferase